MASQAELTPCGAMFDIFKRAAHLSHIELCGLVLSSRPLADGRSPQSRAADRSWVSRFIVRAPVGTLQERYFADYGTSAARIMSQLALRRRNPMDSTAVINMVCGPAGEPMVRALEECHQDTNLYRNALDRLSQAAELMPAERAEAVLVLFVAVGCSADVRSSERRGIWRVSLSLWTATRRPRMFRTRSPRWREFTHYAVQPHGRPCRPVGAQGRKNIFGTPVKVVEMESEAAPPVPFTARWAPAL